MIARRTSPLLYLAAAIVLLFATHVSQAQPQIAVNPQEIDGQNGEVIQFFEVTIANRGNQTLLWTSREDVISEPNRAGPGRGDLLATFHAPFNSSGGMAWDDDDRYMWGCSYGESRICALNTGDQIVANFACIEHPISLSYITELNQIWTSQLGSSTIHQYDCFGHQTGTFDAPFDSIAGQAYDPADGIGVVYMNCISDGNIHVIRVSDQRDIQHFEFRSLVGQLGDFGAIAWAPADHPGKLWANAAGHAFQFKVDADDSIEVIQSFASSSDTLFSGIGFDGYNIWTGSWSNNE